jgi:hypothetical protein
VPSSAINDSESELTTSAGQRGFIRLSLSAIGRDDSGFASWRNAIFVAEMKKGTAWVKLASRNLSHKPFTPEWVIAIYVRYNFVKRQLLRFRIHN